MGVDKTITERQRRYRQKAKLENETRGNAAVNPVTYKKDIPTQAWVESRYLATLSEWLDRRKRTRRLSEVVQEGIRVLVDHLVNNGDVRMVDDSVAAQDMLIDKYGIVIRRGYGARGKNNSLHNAVLTERRREVAGSIESNEPPRDMRGEVVFEEPKSYKEMFLEGFIKEHGMTPEEAAQKAAEEKRLKEEKEKKAKKDNSKPVKETIWIPPHERDKGPAESKPAVTREGMSDEELRQQEQDSLDKLKDM